MKNKKFVASAVSAALVASVVAPVVANAATGEATTKTNIKDVKLKSATVAKVYYKNAKGKTVSKDVKLQVPTKHLSQYSVIPWEGKNVRWNYNERVQLPQQKSFAKHLAKAQAAVTAGEISVANESLTIAKKHFNNMSSLYFSVNTLKSYKEKLVAVEEAVKALAVTVKAINDTTVEVAYKSAVQDVKALSFAIDGLEIKNAVIKQGTDNVVVLTTAKMEAGKTYTVKESGVTLGTVKAPSNVIPTAISLDTKSTQGVVGKEVTLKATVTVPDGQSKEGIPVTFNVDAANNQLNKDSVTEVLTDANGVATYTYTQYAGYEDVVVSYPTGNAALRETGKVYWGVKPILTVSAKDVENTANGTVKTYTVSYVNPLTGNAIPNAKIHVNFQENMDTPVTNDTAAKATDVTTGVGKTPSQTTTTQNPLTLTTNAKGEATFTVSGANTTATPVVWVDNSGLATTADNRFEATELQTVAAAAKFVGAQYTFKFNKSETFDVPVNTNTPVDNTTAPAKYFEYEVEVLKADGKPYAGGTAVVDISENIDDSIATSSSAKIYGEKNVVKLGSGAYKLSLDANGKAKFKVYSNTPNTVATPVVWVDINDATNQTGKLEKEESNAKAGSAVFRAEVLAAAKLTDLTITDNKGAGAYAYQGTEKPVYQIELLDQAGNAFVGTDGIANATYVLTNTGSSEMNVTLAPGAGYTIERVTNGTATNTNLVQTIAAGQSITVYGKVAGNTKKVDLGVSVTMNNKAADLKVSGSVSTLKSGTTITGTNIYDVNGNIIGTINNGTVTSTSASNYFAAGEVSTSFVDAPNYDVNQGYNGTVVGYYTKPATAGGKVIVKLDGRNEYVTISYTNTTPLLTGSTLTNLSSTTEEGFETAISVNDTIAYNTPQVNTVGATGVKLGLGNVDNSSNAKQYATAGGTVTPPAKTLTITFDAAKVTNNTLDVNVGATVAEAELQALVTKVVDNAGNEVLAADRTITVNPTTVDTTKEGTATVTYTVTDKAGNTGTATLTVNVKAPLAANQVPGTYTGGLISKVEVTLKAGQTVAGVTVNGIVLAAADYKVTNNVLRLVNVAKTDKITFTVDGEATPYEVVIQ